MSEAYERTVLVTGGAGFIGSNYLNTVVPRYPHYHFINIDNLTSVADLANITVADSPNYIFSKTDIRDRGALKQLFAEHKPTHIVHFAAESHVDMSIKNPQVFLETNVLGTANLLSLAHDNGVVRYHQISTDEVYGSLNPGDPAFTEASQIRPNNPYSASKAAADHLVHSYHNTFGLDTVITRCSNNYGPRQDITKFIPRAITALLRNEKIPVYGNGENVRDWLHVTDHVEAIDLVFHTGIPGEIYNVGTDNEWKNIDIARELLAILDKGEASIEFVTDRPGHDLRYAINASKIQSLGWSARVSFIDGLRNTVSWYQTKS